LLEQASESENPEDRSLRLIAKGDLSGALEVWKTATIKQSSNPKNWRGLAHVLDLMNESDKSKTAQSHAERIESKAIADKTGRKMEDILADLLDDGILNFSAGSDAGANSNIQILPAADDLTRLPGIGKVSAQKLSDAGITTFEQVSKVENSKIMEIINAKKLDNWSELAKKLQEDW
ncbi:helix-hairpin-helix domain-containing protein, partial [Euryarchaeota archaeon]|nr:helix-hairpin-helix domain-containing protein [Euryarchaeota archaeon]